MGTRGPVKCVVWNDEARESVADAMKYSGNANEADGCGLRAEDPSVKESRATPERRLEALQHSIQASTAIEQPPFVFDTQSAKMVFQVRYSSPMPPPRTSAAASPRPVHSREAAATFFRSAKLQNRLTSILLVLQTLARRAAYPTYKSPYGPK